MSEVTGPDKQVRMNYGGNSNKQKDAATASPERVKLDKVIEGDVVERKKGFGRKLRESFQGEDAQSIGSFVFWDVIVPKLKDLTVDAINESTHRAFYGARSGSGSSAASRSTARPTAYNRIAYQQAPTSNSDPRRVSAQVQATHGFDEIAFPNIGAAEKVLDTLTEYVEKYGFVSVMDFYDFCGFTNGEFTDEKYGWDNLNTAKVRRTREGYILELPATKQRD
jgi:hypothetical protein